MKSKDQPTEAPAADAAAPEIAPPPGQIDIRTADHETLRRIRVVDAATGAAITNIIAADAIAGSVERHQLDDAGNLVREGDHFVVINEARAIRIEWREEIA